MAKFKVGDWVVYKDGYHGRWKVIQTKVQGISDKIRLQNYDGKTEDTYEECVKVDNSLSTNSVVANAMAARVARNGYADTPSGKKRLMIESDIEKIIKSFKGNLSKMKDVAKREYASYKKSDPDNAFLIEEIDGWIDGLERAVESVW